MDVNLILFKKNGSQKSFAMPEGNNVIGRRHDCDFCLPLQSVSRRHCQFNLNNSTLILRDMGSKNGTYVNGEKIEECQLKPGDYVQIPPVTFLIQIDGKPAKISPPTPAEEKPPSIKSKPAPKEEKPKQQEAEELPDLGDDSFADLDLDAEGSDSFLADLEDL